MRNTLAAALLGLYGLSAAPHASATEALDVKVRLPERMRVLNDQLFDLRVEATGLTGKAARLDVTVDGRRWTGLAAPETSFDNDAAAADHDQQWTFRAVSLAQPGVHVVEATVHDGQRTAKATTRVGVQQFRPVGKKSLILFIGDGMGTAYRDAGRIVSRSADNGLREGYYDRMLEMDQMPVSGMVLTHALNSLVPDSANTASAWSSGNKTVVGALSAFPDNTDFKVDGGEPSATRAFALDNPRVESLWEYLKRRHGYRTGVVSTAEITDATPAAEGAHVISRKFQYDIAKQFVTGTFVKGSPFDVILGGGRTYFTQRLPALAGDARDLAAELKSDGFDYVQSRTELAALQPRAGGKLLGLFHDSNMTVTYDKLGYKRPADETSTAAAAFPDQPFLDEMVKAAISVLDQDGKPFILMVEGAQIDKQSHKNQASGVLWDVIEFDKAVGVGRAFAKQRPGKVLTVVTADHDQTMTLLGVSDTQAAGSIQNLSAVQSYATGGAPVDQAKLAGSVERFPDYKAAKDTGYPANDNRYRLAVGFRTGDHAASSVPLTAEGPGALLFTGYMDQTDVFFKMAKALGSDTRRLDTALDTRDEFSILNRDEAVTSHH